MKKGLLYYLDVRRVYGSSLVFLLMIVLEGSIPAAVNMWTTHGPYGGTIQALLVVPQRPNEMYAGVEDGGFFRSRNWGLSWEAIPAVGQNVEDVKVTKDGSRLYACGQDGIFSSTDQGVTWTQQSLSYHMSLAIHPATPRVIYASSTGGISKTVDAGETWEQLENSPDTQVDDVAISPFSPYYVYAGTTDQGIFRSSNEGVSWQNIRPPASEYEFARVACHPSRPGWVYACTWIPGGFFVSSDSGDHWTKYQNGVNFTDLVFDPEDPDVLYTQNLFGTYRSSDGGASWVKILERIGRAMAANLLDSNGFIYAGTADGVYRSKDKGGSWKRVSNGMGEVDYCLARDPGNPGHVYLGDYAGNIWKSENSGLNWQQLPFRKGSMWISSLAVIPGETPVILACINGSLFRSPDGGSSWDHIMDGHIYRVAAHSSPPYDVYAVSGWPGFSNQELGVFKSVDSGENWTNLGLSGENLTAIALDSRDSNNIFAGGDSGLFRTSDGGDNWTPVSLGGEAYDIHAIAISPADNDVVFAGCYREGIFRSTNGGDSWTPVNTGLPEHPWIGFRVHSLACDPYNSSIVYAGMEEGLFNTSNGGTSWEPSPPVSGNRVQALQFQFNEKKYLFAGTKQGLFVKSFGFFKSVSVHNRTGEVGTVNTSVSSQVLPASYVTLAISPSAFSLARPDRPIILQLRLPDGVTLSQTLATGDLQTVSPEPEAGERVFPLAVSEYDFNPLSSTYDPVNVTKNLSGISSDAVQLFRCVAGEDRIWIRFNESTADWSAAGSTRFLGVTLGIGAGVWPVDDSSNWGDSGRFKQENTQFFVDLRGFDFIENNGFFPASLSAFFQHNGLELYDVLFDPPTVNLFALEQETVDELFPSSRLGSKVAGFATADLDRDGREDLITIDGEQERIFWQMGSADGSFGEMDWIVTPGVVPATIAAGDVTGDGRPDIVVGTSDGFLQVYFWENLFGAKQRHSKYSVADLKASLAGSPTASALEDMNGDQQLDFLYVDQANETFNVIWGSDFSQGQSFTAGVEPVAVAAGDFNGDLKIDVAVANSSSNSVSVFLNTGSGFISDDFQAGGQRPVDIKTADFNRDGRDDIAVVLAGSNALRTWYADAGGGFSAKRSGTVFFLREPSALAAANFDGLNGPDVMVGFKEYHSLALCASDQAGDLTYSYGLNTLGDLELDPVNHMTLVEDNIVSIGAGMGAGGISSRSGVAALGEMPMNLIHFPRSRDLSLSVVNLGDTAALFNLELYRGNGTLRNTATQSIQPQAQFVRYLSDPSLLGNQADDSGQWVRAFLTQPATYGFWLANESAQLDYLDGLRMPSALDARTEFCLPVILTGGDRFTEAIVINPHEHSTSIRVQLMGDGQVRSVQTLFLAARSRQKIETEVMFPSAGADDFLVIRASGPVICLEMFGDSSKLATLEGIPLLQDRTDLYGPHVATGDFGVVYESILTMVNPSEETAALDLYLLNDQGQIIGSVSDLSLSPQTKFSAGMDEIFQLKSGPVSGYIRVELKGSISVYGCVTFGEQGDGRFLSSLPLLSSTGNRYLVGHLANGTLGDLTFYTGIAIVNPDDLTRDVSLRAYDQNGVLLDSRSLSIPANERRVFLLHQMMTGLINIFGGYMVVEETGGTDGRLMVFALFGNTANDFMSAVPAVPLR